MWASCSTCSVGDIVLLRHGPAIIAMKVWALIPASGAEAQGAGPFDNAMVARLAASAQAEKRGQKRGVSVAFLQLR